MAQAAIAGVLANGISGHPSSQPPPPHPEPHQLQQQQRQPPPPHPSNMTESPDAMTGIQGSASTPASTTPTPSVVVPSKRKRDTAVDDDEDADRDRNSRSPAGDAHTTCARRSLVLDYLTVLRRCVSRSIPPDISECDRAGSPLGYDR